MIDAVLSDHKLINYASPHLVKDLDQGHTQLRFILKRPERETSPATTVIDSIGHQHVRPIKNYSLEAWQRRIEEDRSLAHSNASFRLQDNARVQCNILGRLLSGTATLDDLQVFVDLTQDSNQTFFDHISEVNTKQETEISRLTAELEAMILQLKEKTAR